MIKTLADMFQGGVDAVRNAALSPQDTKSRKNAETSLEMIKQIAVVCSIASVFFFTIFPALFTLFSAGLTCFAASEVHKVCNNLLEMLRSAMVEGAARVTKESFYKQFEKDTYVAGSILRSLDPDLKGFVLTLTQ